MRIRRKPEPVVVAVEPVAVEEVIAATPELVPAASPSCSCVCAPPAPPAPSLDAFWALADTVARVQAAAERADAKADVIVHGLRTIGTTNIPSDPNWDPDWAVI